MGNLRVTITQWSSWTWIELVLHIQYQIGIWNHHCHCYYQLATKKTKPIQSPDTDSLTNKSHNTISSLMGFVVPELKIHSINKTKPILYWPKFIHYLRLWLYTRYRKNPTQLSINHWNPTNLKQKQTKFETPSPPFPPTLTVRVGDHSSVPLSNSKLKIK